MSVPVLIVTGFLGAGKTTLINRLLTEADGRRIAAIVNDFGAINIDADLIATRSGDVIGLENGCICCSLQGDLLRTLKSILGRDDPVDQIVIEASGVADPHGILTAVIDPALHRAVRLSGVLAVVDAAECADTPARLQDPLWRAQVAAANFVALAKLGGDDAPGLRDHLKAAGAAFIFDADATPLPGPAILDADMEPRGTGQATLLADERFARLEWRWTGGCSLADFQALIGRWSGRLLRAKGILNFTERPGSSFLFQLVGRRATLEPLGSTDVETRLVLIGEKQQFDTDRLHDELIFLFVPS